MTKTNTTVAVVVPDGTTANESAIASRAAADIREFIGGIKTLTEAELHQAYGPNATMADVRNAGKVATFLAGEFTGKREGGAYTRLLAAVESVRNELDRYESKRGTRPEPTARVIVAAVTAARIASNAAQRERTATKRALADVANSHAVPSDVAHAASETLAAMQEGDDFEAFARAQVRFSNALQAYATIAGSGDVASTILDTVGADYARQIARYIVELTREDNTDN
jgi:hypothetical protein